MLSSAHELFLRNQREFDHSVQVLWPFEAAALVATLLAFGLASLGRGPGARALLWTHHLAGAGFLVYSFVRGVPAFDHLGHWALDTAAGAAAVGVVFLATLAFLARRDSPAVVELPLAVLAAVLIVGEGAGLARRLEAPPRPAPLPEPPALQATEGLPNVYHVVLDGFQDELLEAALPAAGDAALAGFVRFPATRSPGRTTRYALPAALVLRSPEGEQRPSLHDAFLGNASLLQELRSRGYTAVGLVPFWLYQGAERGFDWPIDHAAAAQGLDAAPLHALAFRQLWLYSVAPLAVMEPLARRHALKMNAGMLRDARNQRLSVHTQPLAAQRSLRWYLEVEARLPANGRYTFLHVLLPHGPYLLNDDCSFETASRPTDLLEQTRCTLRLLVELLDELDHLGRLHGSVVVVHGDHGSGEVLEGERLVPDESAYFRTLLLVKPVGAAGPMRRAGGGAALWDVAPTLLALLGYPVDPESVAGRVLEEALE